MKNFARISLQYKPRKDLFAFLVMLLWAMFFLLFVGLNPSHSQETDQESTPDATSSDQDDSLESLSGQLETFEAHPDFATIYIVRKKKFRASGVNKKIYFNYHYMGKIGNGRYGVYLVPPGEYSLGVFEDKDKRSITLTVDNGKIYYARLKVTIGFGKGKGEFLHISEEDAKAMIQKLKKVKDKDIEEYQGN